MTLLATGAPVADAATIDFSSIGGYNHWRVVGTLSGAGPNAVESLYLQFNGDSGVNYDWNANNVTAAGANAPSSGAADSKGVCGLIESADASAGATQIDLVFSKPFTGQYGKWSSTTARNVGGGGGNIQRNASGTWKNTANLITRVTFGCYDGDNFDANVNKLFLYGVT